MWEVGEVSDRMKCRRSGSVGEGEVRKLGIREMGKWVNGRVRVVRGIGKKWFGG